MVNNRILILGGSGFIGSALTKTLLDRGYSVTTISRHPGTNVSHPHYTGSIQDPRFLLSVFKANDIVIHLADSLTPATSELNPEEVLLQARTAASAILDAAKSAGISHLIYTSSGGTVYGEASAPLTETSPTQPINTYGKAKLGSENAFISFSKEHALPLTILRIANVYGRKDLSAKKPAIDIFLANAISNKEVIINGDGTIVRDYIFIDDVVECLIHVLEKKIEGIFNIGTQKGTSLNEALSLIGTIIGKELHVERKPRKSQDIQYNVLDITKIKESGWQPHYSLSDGIKNILKSYGNPS
jgi:UDP-glucose 4-epimerase